MSQFALPQAAGMSIATLPPRVKDKATVNRAGDSVTAGNDDTAAADPTFRWSVQLEAAWSAAFTAAGKTPPVYTLTAVSGQTTTQLVADITAQIKTPAKQVLLIMASVNDVFFGVATATTQSNYRTIFRTQLQVRPDSAIFVISPVFLQGENWPLGVNANDAAIGVMNEAIRQVCIEPEFSRYVTWVDIRTGMFQFEATDNPLHKANSVLTQQFGTHPSKPLGQTRMSALAQAAIPLDFT